MLSVSSEHFFKNIFHNTCWWLLLLVEPAEEEIDNDTRVLSFAIKGERKKFSKTLKA